MGGEEIMMKFNSIEEFAQFTDVDTLVDIQYHLNRALEQIRDDSMKQSREGEAIANISISLYEDYFLLIEFNYSWDNEVFKDDKDVKLTLFTLDEWLDYYNEHKSQFKFVANS
jgi:hypothetical protein